MPERNVPFKEGNITHEKMLEACPKGFGGIDRDKLARVHCCLLWLRTSVHRVR